MTDSVFKFIWHYLAKLKWLFFSVVLLILGGEVFYKVSLYEGAKIIELLSSNQDKDIILHHALIMVGIFSLFMFLHRICYDSTVFFEARFLPLFVSRISKDLFNFAHQHSTAFFAEEMAGNVAAKIWSIIDKSHMLYYNVLWGFIYPFFSIAVCIVLVLKINIEIGLMMLAFNVFYIYLTYKLTRKISPYAEHQAKMSSEANGILVDSISNASLVKSFSNYSFEKKNYFRGIKKLAYADRKMNIVFGILDVIQGVIRAVLQIFFYAIPIYYWHQDKIGLADFVLIQSLNLSLMMVYVSSSHSFMQFFKLYGGIKDGLNLLSKPYDIVDVPRAKKLEVKEAPILFDDITYHYKGAKALFKHFTLDVKAGEKIGLVGHSGSGKSTLIKILSRYYDLQDGKILIDGQDIAEITQDSLRKNIGLIPQDASLFNRTIMDNIRYGNLKATDEDVFESAKKAHIHDFVLSLKNGYDTKVGERGVMLSGGERQRIAIARAILKNAPILILDEATSALDSVSEEYIQRSMKTLMTGKTVIAIAHRLSTLKEMDKIVVMDKGKIVEIGSQEELLNNKNSIFYGFYQMQSQGFLKL